MSPLGIVEQAAGGGIASHLTWGLCSSYNRAKAGTLPACLLRRWLILGVEEPFPRGRKSAAPFTVRKLSLMLQEEGGRERENELLFEGRGGEIKGAGKVLDCYLLLSCPRKTKLEPTTTFTANWNHTSCLSERDLLPITEWLQLSLYGDCKRAVELTHSPLPMLYCKYSFSMYTTVKVT